MWHVYIYTYICMYICICVCVCVYIYAMAYYSAIKNNEILAFVVTWMDLVGTMLSKMSDREKQNIIQLHVYL